MEEVRLFSSLTPDQGPASPLSVFYQRPQGIHYTMKKKEETVYFCWILSFLQALASIDIYCAFAQVFDEKKSLVSTIEKTRDPNFVKTARAAMGALRILTTTALTSNGLQETDAASQLRQFVLDICNYGADRDSKGKTSFDDPNTLILKVIPIWHEWMQREKGFNFLHMSPNVHTFVKARQDETFHSTTPENVIANSIPVQLGLEANRTSVEVSSLLQNAYSLFVGDRSQLMQYVVTCLPQVLFLYFPRVLDMYQNINDCAIEYNLDSIAYKRLIDGSQAEYKVMASIELDTDAKKVGPGTHYVTYARRLGRWYKINGNNISELNSTQYPSRQCNSRVCVLLLQRSR